MKNPDPDSLTSELSEFNTRLAAGMSRIAALGEIKVGETPRELVYTQDKLKLYHYAPDNPLENDIPILIVYALVNRPYMLDMQQDRSFIKGLVDAGKTVYLIDWGDPDKADRHLQLDDYINGYIDDCVDAICQRHGLEKVNLMGVCQGGTFSLCYSAMNPEKINALVTLVTPVDFKTADNTLSHWVQQVDVDQMIDALGLVPGAMLNATFASMKPFRLLGQKYVNMVDVMGDDAKLENFLRMEKWINDSPPQAGEAFRQFLKDFYQDNKLIQGTLVLGGESVELANVNMPLLNVYAEQDHLVPPAASKALDGLTGSTDYSEYSFPGGHIGIFVSSRSQKVLPLKLASWFNQFN